MSEHTISSGDQAATTQWKLFISIFLKTTALSFLFVFIFLLITAGVVGAVAFSKLNQFEKAAQIDRNELFSMVREGWQTEPNSVNNTITFLILGVDTLANRGSVKPLTDTMILATVHLDSGEIHLLSLPRDLWSTEYKTKLNALYSYGEEKHPGQPEKFPLKVTEDLTGITVQHTVVISLDTLATLIDTLGGITVDVPAGFKDEMFPRTDVDVTVERDPAMLYKTIEFQTGQQVMDGQTALEYIRSRHSDDPEGSDTARSARQQLVIRSIMQKLLTANTLKSPETLAKLYRLYSSQFSQYMSISTAVSITKKLYPVRNSIVLYSEGLSIYPDSSSGVIYHPAERQFENQWVYAIREPELFKKEVQTKLLQSEENQVEYTGQ